MIIQIINVLFLLVFATMFAVEYHDYNGGLRSKVWLFITGSITLTYVLKITFGV